MMNYNTNYFALQNRGKDSNGEAQNEKPAVQPQQEVEATSEPVAPAAKPKNPDPLNYTVPPPVFIKPKVNFRPLSIKGTSRTPEVNFNPVSSAFSVTGRSIPEDSMAFYKRLTDWIGLMEEHHSFDQPAKFVFELEYFNTSSSKCLLDVFKRINKLHLIGKPVSILWRYDEDDEDLMETGEDYRDLLDLPFELESVEY